MIYALAQLSFTDLPRYRRYQSKFAESFAGSGGDVLAADEDVQILEGEWPYQKAVLLRFPDEQSYRRWYTSDAYQAIIGDRQGATLGSVVLIRGLPAVTDPGAGRG